MPNDWPNSSLPAAADEAGSSSMPRMPGSRGCKFIAGDPRSDDWSYCGQPVARAGSAWCEKHYPIIYAGGGKKLAPVAASQPAMPNAVAEKSPPKAEAPAPQAASVRTGSLEDPLLLG
jgi:hypothetical protein